MDALYSKKEHYVQLLRILLDVYQKYFPSKELS